MKTESNGIVTLTAADGYSDYKWHLDASSAVVSEKATYSFTPSEGYTMVFVTAKKKWRNIQCNLLHLIEEITKVVVDGSARLELTGRCGTEAGFRVARSITN